MFYFIFRDVRLVFLLLYLKRFIEAQIFARLHVTLVVGLRLLLDFHVYNLHFYWQVDDLLGDLGDVVLNVVEDSADVKAAFRFDFQGNDVRLVIFHGLVVLVDGVDNVRPFNLEGVYLFFAFTG